MADVDAPFCPTLQHMSPDMVAFAQRNIHYHDLLDRIANLSDPSVKDTIDVLFSGKSDLLFDSEGRLKPEFTGNDEQLKEAAAKVHAVREAGAAGAYAGASAADRRVADRLAHAAQRAEVAAANADREQAEDVD